MADEPMSDERLNEIRARAEAIRDWLLTPESAGKGHFPTSRRLLGVDALALLAEVDRLRAREAAAMAIVQAVKDRGVYFTLQNGRHCYFCEAETETYTGEPPHKADCPVAKARALLAQE